MYAGIEKPETSFHGGCITSVIHVTTPSLTAEPLWPSYVKKHVCLLWQWTLFIVILMRLTTDMFRSDICSMLLLGGAMHCIVLEFNPVECSSWDGCQENLQSNATQSNLSHFLLCKANESRRSSQIMSCKWRTFDFIPLKWLEWLINYQNSEFITFCSSFRLNKTTFSLLDLELHSVVRMGWRGQQGNV